MAKQPKAASAPAPAAPADQAAPATAPKTTKSPIPPKGSGDNDLFVRVYGADGKGVLSKKADGTDLRLAPQAQLIANLIEAKGERAGITRKALVDILVPNGLITRQPPGRILAYYMKPLVDAGVITVTKGAPAAAPAK